MMDSWTPPKSVKPKPLVTDGKRVHRETGSPFDTTHTTNELLDPPGAHVRVTTPPDPTAFSASGARLSVAKPDPRLFLTRHSGFGGAASTIHRGMSEATLRPATAGPILSRSSLSGRSGSGSPSLAVSGSRALPSSPLSFSSSFSPSTSSLASPPRAGAASPRRNPPNTELRRCYERSDLPCLIDCKAGKNRLAWRVAWDKLDYTHYLPLFFDGLREEEQPYKFVALEGVKGLVQNGGSKILPVIPHLIVPIRNAINTRRTGVIVQTLDALKMLLLSDVRSPAGPMVARALVPYYRQILPVLNIFYSHNKNLGDQTDYGQRRCDVLGDRIEELLNLLETYGGEDAFINIKYLIPTYQSILAVGHK